MSATGGWNWGTDGRLPITQTFDPGPTPPAGPPTKENGPWIQDGIMYKHDPSLGGPFWISDVTGKIKAILPGDWNDQVKTVFLKTLGLDTLIATFPAGSHSGDMTAEGAQTLCNILGADKIQEQPVITISNDPNSTAKSSFSIVWDPDGEPRLAEPVALLAQFAKNPPAYVLDTLRVQVMRSRLNSYTSYVCDPVWFVNEVLKRAV